MSVGPPNMLPCEQSSIKTVIEFLQPPSGYAASLTGIQGTHKASDHIRSSCVFNMNIHLVLLDLSACSESFDISMSLMASLTSSFSTESIIRRRACREAIMNEERAEIEMLEIIQTHWYNLRILVTLKNMAALCRHCQTETSAMPSGMAGNCPSLRLSTPANLS